jgi:hypothetical protein
MIEGGLRNMSEQHIYSTTSSSSDLVKTCVAVIESRKQVNNLHMPPNHDVLFTLQASGMRRRAKQ